MHGIGNIFRINVVEFNEFRVLCYVRMYCTTNNLFKYWRVWFDHNVKWYETVLENGKVILVFNYIRTMPWRFMWWWRYNFILGTVQQAFWASEKLWTLSSRDKSLIPANNRFSSPRSPSLEPSRYTDWAIPLIFYSYRWKFILQI
jgi:hypothetical protein